MKIQNEFIDLIHSCITKRKESVNWEHLLKLQSLSLNMTRNLHSLYVSYLYCDLESATFNNKQLTKPSRKIVQYKMNNTLLKKIISELIKDKDIDKALEGVSNVY
jgi:hypothetical protein